ncbi:hypothetical protein McaMca56_003987 [Microsporum canis]
MDGTIILTGATGGLGQELTKRLLRRPEPYTLVFPVRNSKHAHTIKLRQIISSHGKSSHITSMPELNLAYFDSIRAFASDINNKVSSGVIPPIRALILNAALCFEPNGLQFTEKQKQSQHPPFEMHFAVNYLANVLLSLLLLGSIDQQHGRIVFTSSWAHDIHRPENQRFGPKKLSWNVADLAHPDMSKLDQDMMSEAMRRYGASKLALVTFMHTLRRRLDRTPHLENITIVGVDPGAMLHDNLAERGSLADRAFLIPLIQLYTRLIARYFWPNGMFRTAEKSAQDLLRVALESKASWAHPKEAYFNGNELAETAIESRDSKKQKELWGMSLRFLPAVICGTIGHTKYQVAPASCVFQSDCVYGIDILLEVLKATRVAVTYQDEFQYSLQAVNIVSNMLHHVALEPETEHVGLRFTGIQESSIGRYKKGPAKLVNLNLQGHSSNLINSNAFLVD